MGVIPGSQVNHNVRGHICQVPGDRFKVIHGIQIFRIHRVIRGQQQPDARFMQVQLAIDRLLE